ncbi:hypothetical protein BRARA_B02690 [Brassica rapa]|uniref:TTF-type domain-containing protein n=1 Tax=Brassica campestris TaxID=3711 RepID=A0A398AKA1_BRACM|nr:hypothetical protein BRARA_B02690 [Brassica rapa]
MEKFVNLKRKEPSPSCDLDDLPWDLLIGKKISEYPSNKRDEKMISGAMRRFNHAWFDQYKNWLEYSIKKDAAYCLCCYLFRDSNGKGGKTDAWTNEGFSSWNKFSRLAEHVGKVNSFHNNAVMRDKDDITNNEYRIRLNASIDVSRYLLRQGLSFRGHDESETSANKGNFMELLKYTAEQNEAVIKVVLQNAPGNNQMVSSKIQKDIAHCFAEEVIKSIIDEIDHDVFGLLVDESADVSDKEQMAVVFQFVDKSGIVKERFISIIHVAETSSLGLSIKKLRGQGYDGASNMKGEYNGLRSLILRENTSAYYVYCFAHQLQLVVVAVAKKHFEVGGFFDMISLLLNVVAIQRPRQTRWGSHYKTLLCLIELFSPFINVLKHIQNEGLEDSKRRQAYGLLVYFQDFDFVFYLQMMVHLLGLTDSLSKALQQRDQDILNAMSLVKSTKRQLQDFRDNGWHSLMDKFFSFCEKYGIEKVDMEDEFIHPKRPRKKTGVQNMHHYKVNCLYAVLDLQLQEFNDHFTEVNTELLTCVASLSPIVDVAKFYPYDFSHTECISLEQQLFIYIDNLRHDEKFSHLKNLGDLARMLVDTRKHLSLPLVYKLLKLALILPVATATVERCFSAMKIVKTDRRNRISDEFLNDCLVYYIEKDAFQNVTNETAMKRFQDIKDRRMLL